jgi:hypothetical protein
MLTTLYAVSVVAGFLSDARADMSRATYALRAAEMEREAGVRRDLLALARRLATKARDEYATAVQALQDFGVALAHHYQRDTGDAFQGVVTLAEDRGAWLWRSGRRYAHRQSAQRAALREMGRIQA